MYYINFSTKYITNYFGHIIDLLKKKITININWKYKKKDNWKRFYANKNGFV